ncbi:MAG: UDP-galactopyranose mutase [Thermoleophilaceae bacterium]|jgi:UDP-galactopyranose mutase|nr:UDP-galactopyranose mutase [Thermoleophilaceae bacterium]
MDAYDTLVVGAGYAGSVMARELAIRSGQRVLVIDRRDHIAGNAYDYRDDHGVLVHAYGPHIFHTNSEKVVEYLSAFTEWMPYEHRVLARVDGKLVPMPINRTTINELYGLSLATDEEVESFMQSRAEPVEHVRTSEDVVVAKVGRELYEKFFRGYTRKQWQRDPSELHASVCARIPIRTDADDRYFGDAFQKMPAGGYTAMFRRILDHPLIDVRLETDYWDVKDEIGHDRLVYTGPIDGFFGHRFGKLPYRSLEFDLRTEATPDLGYAQEATTVNEPSEEVPYTRVTEFRRMTGQARHEFSTLAVEYPRAEGDPYYPIPNDETRALYRRYEALGTELPNVTFVGRLARYQYLNMDQVVGQALSAADKLIASLPAAA